ncbi:PREDICTED: uncharacterized protein LOC109131240 [Camelina sativa]|uniref:Uncharacterized protein LOC109131240 n=1 Tax=Camelina sativa TaxID=90675 RepID=A0ABM1REP3_CAMSA|nr:PREDICTED: uncharacterized protein LOC109131240 [Camelina sativa]
MIASNNDSAVTGLKDLLKSEFKIKDVGPARFFFGLEISGSLADISVCERKYAQNLLEDACLLGCKPSSIPMDHNLHLTKIWARHWRIHGLTESSLAAYKVLRYIKANPGQGLMYSADSELCLNAFCDADWANCKDTRCYVTGFCVYLGTSLISWKSKNQGVTSRSSTESEYRSMAQATCEIIWLQQLLRYLHIQVTCPAKLFYDNKSALHIAMNPMFHERMKHIEIDCHTVCDQIKAGKLKALHVSSENQHDDILTKPLHPGPFHHLLQRMSLSSLYLPPLRG